MAVDLTDPAALARQLDELAGDPVAIERMGKAARAAAVDRLCWEKDSHALLKSVENALAPAARNVAN